MCWYSIKTKGINEHRQREPVYKLPAQRQTGKHHTYYTALMKKSQTKQMPPIVHEEQRGQKVRRRILFNLRTGRPRERPQGERSKCAHPEGCILSRSVQPRRSYHHEQRPPGIYQLLRSC